MGWISKIKGVVLGDRVGGASRITCFQDQTFLRYRAGVLWYALHCAGEVQEGTANKGEGDRIFRSSGSHEAL